MEGPFVYSPIVEPRHIRLLQILVDQSYQRALDEAVRREPNQTSRHVLDEDTELDPSAAKERPTTFKALPRLKGRFVVASLTNLTHSYKAVSYVWGNPATPHKVWIDDSYYLEVTESAMEVLNHIAMSEMDNYVWIDALCINQKDNEEKGRQVRLMYDVYSRAKEVVAWTGRPSVDSQLALEFVSTLHREIRRLYGSGTPLTRTSITKVNGCQWPSPKWTALAQFFRRPFFHRVWIVQEMVAAKQIRMACGTCFVDWEELAEVIGLIYSTGAFMFLEIPDEFGMEFSTCGATAVMSILSLRCHIKYNRILPPLPYVLTMCQDFGSTDSRDMIFALLNISSGGNDEVLAPDYNKPMATVFIDTTRHMLTKTSPLISLLYSSGIGHIRAVDELPSWVPDWSSHLSNMSLGLAADAAVLLHLEQYHACGRDFELTTIPTCSGGASMSLRGRIIDTVKSYYDGRPKMQVQAGASRENVTRSAEWLLHICYIFPDNFIYPTGAPFFPDILSNTLVAGKDEYGKLPPDLTDTQFVDFFAIVFLTSGIRDKKKEDMVPELIMERINVLCSELLTLGHFED